MDTERIADIIEKAQAQGRKDGLAGWDKADSADVADLTTEAARVLGYGPDDLIPVRESMDIWEAIGKAYNAGWITAYKERGGGRAMSDLAVAMQIPYDTLAKAAREERLKAWKSGGTWLSTWGAVEEAIAAGSIKPRRQQAGDPLQSGRS